MTRSLTLFVRFYTEVCHTYKNYSIMAFHDLRGKIGYVYIVSNYKRDVIYVGVTDDLIRRIWDHKNGKGSVFTSRYNVKYLIYFEEYPNIEEAISREKQLKNWHREWKFNLIKKENPHLEDLWHKLL